MMLKRQSPDKTPMSFLAGNSDMARIIRDFDWSANPIGAPETWPQSLRSALSICLNSAFPTAIYWGSDLRLLYNDPWSGIPGPRHPACLGEPAREVWSDIWHVIEPQFTEVIETGEGLFAQDQFLPMRRFGFDEETYWSYSFTPIRGEDGSIEGIFNSGMETTARVLNERQTAFLLRVIDSLRSCGNAQDVMQLACQMLGEHLGAIRVGIREVDSSTRSMSSKHEWQANGIAAAGDSIAWDELGSIASQLQDRQVVRIEKTSDLESPEARALQMLGAGSVLAVPSTSAGKLKSALYVHRAEAHAWTDDEVSTAEQVFARVVQALDAERSRAREKAMMQEIDHRARNMLGVSQALIRLAPATDAETMRTSLLERTRALGNTLQILSESKWVGASFEKLLKSELAPYLDEDDARLSISGPKVMVDPVKSQPVSMALHELTTNAAKYGGLSRPEGRIDISWTVGPDGLVAVDWLEKNVQSEDGRKMGGTGFGSTLLKMLVENQIGGTITTEIRDAQFHCRLEMALSRSG